MADGKVIIETGLDSTGVEDGLKSLAGITAKGLKAATVAVAGTTTALGGIATAAVKIGSDFEAQMSRVKAISGATGEGFEKLRQQAIDLGADTAFSASEAAQGMENLAAAGFEVDEIYDAMPGMLDLAAASGEDLAASADIAASTLRGFGLEAGDAAHVADVLAENANRTNSSVYETGEAMKYVAPLARASGISMEETAAAIGIMANAGIQGSQAGTTLRGALSRLSKPTDVMKEAMEELGVSFYDSEGKMLSLSDQVGMLKGAMEGMTDEQKNNYLVTLYGQEALSGMLALINEGPEKLSELTAAYESCDGAAQEAAETMQDNLKGAIEELSGSAETLGIVFYDSVAESLKSAAQTATESVNNITDAFNNGGLDAAIETAGDEFANLASDVAEQAPEMVDAAIAFIKSFAKGIKKNKKKLFKSAGEIAGTLAGGLVELLPKEIREPVEEAIEAISDSLNSGGLHTAGETVSRLFENIADVIGVLAETALPLLVDGLDSVAENLNVIGPLVLGAVAAYTSLNTVTTLCSTAQGLLNTVMAASPIALTVAGIVGLTTAIGGFYLATNQQIDATTMMTEEQKALYDQTNELVEAGEASRSSMQKSIETSTQEIATTESLWKELQTLVDENGNVKAGYEERVEYITGELSEALGIELELIDGQVQGYEEQGKAIEDLITLKKAEATLTGMQEGYNEAIDNGTESLKKYLENKKELRSASDELAEAEKRLQEAQVAYDDELDAFGEVSMATNNALIEAQLEVEALKEKQNGLTASTSAAKAEHEANQQTIENYEGLSEAILSGEVEAMEEALLNISANYARFGEVSNEELLQIVTDTSGYMADLGEAIESGAIDATDVGVAEFANMTASYLGELSKMPEGAAAIAGQINPGVLGALALLAPSLTTESSEAVAGFIGALDGVDSETRSKFEAAVAGAIEGSAFGDKVSAKADEMGCSYLEALATILEVHSPSRAVATIFSNIWPGAEQGLEQGKESLLSKGQSIALDFLKNLTSGNVMEGANQAGTRIMNLFANGVTSQQSTVNNAAKNVSDSANKQLGSANTKATGNRKGREYNSGIAAQKKSVNSTSKSMADSSNKLLGAANTRSTGTKKGTEYNTGLKSQKGGIDSTSREIAKSSNTQLGSENTKSTGTKKGTEYNAGLKSQRSSVDATARDISKTANSGLGSADTGATGRRQSNAYNSGLGSANTRATGSRKAQEGRAGLGSVDATGTGINFVQGFINGMGRANVWSAAYNIGKQALNAAKAALQVKSPSRKAMEVGAYFGEGLSIGIKKQKRAVEKSSRSLSTAALEALDMEDVSARMRETMALNTERIAKSFALENSVNIFHSQELENKLHLSEEDIQKLAKRFGVIAGEVVSDNIEGMTMRVYDRDFARVVKEASRS